MFQPWATAGPPAIAASRQVATSNTRRMIRNTGRPQGIDIFYILAADRPIGAAKSHFDMPEI
jgi:hypothetical protein